MDKNNKNSTKDFKNTQKNDNNNFRDSQKNDSLKDTKYDKREFEFSE